MLVLSRKTNQFIKIGESIEVYVTSIRGNRVGLAIAAPDGVRILRGELSRSNVDFEDADDIDVDLSQSPAEPTPTIQIEKEGVQHG